MLIGELSDKTGLSKDTIRYYEKEGLVQSGARKENQYRNFSEKAIHTIHFIKNLKELGFTLPEIKDFIHLFHNEETSCQMVQKRLEDHIVNINSKMSLLESIRTKVANAIHLCKENPIAKSCQTLEKLWD
ncbi:MAG TPA: MerR family transcriptional regulator [Spirochaetes bacterium]|nr:MerR family transcriptional regulator [Spirochaetota bacterium]